MTEFKYPDQTTYLTINDKYESAKHPPFTGDCGKLLDSTPDEHRIALWFNEKSGVDRTTYQKAIKFLIKNTKSIKLQSEESNGAYRKAERTVEGDDLDFLG